jgi:hypothetical protein
MCREAVTALDPRVYDQLLEIAIDDPEKRARNREVWSGLANFYFEVNAPYGRSTGCTNKGEKG